MQSKIVKLDMSGLNNFARGIETGFAQLRVQVGIFGSKNLRKDPETKGMTNADVGFIHEFGGPKIPKRSFLRMPIFYKSEEILEYVKKAGALKKLQDGKSIEVLADIGIACEDVIQQAFASRGFGTWKANSPVTIKRKGSSMPLIDIGELKRSIASAVVRP